MQIGTASALALWLLVSGLALPARADQPSELSCREAAVAALQQRYESAKDFRADIVSCGPPPCPPCPEDVNGDGAINVLDLIDLLLCFGSLANPPCDTGQDVNCDGTVNVLDLIELLLVFGQPCP